MLNDSIIENKDSKSTLVLGLVELLPERRFDEFLTTKQINRILFSHLTSKIYTCVISNTIDELESENVEGKLDSSY